MSATVKTENIEQEFKGKIKAVNGVSIAIDKGEIYGFLGPNGAGKTTMVRMLVTLLRPTGGSAQVAGYDVAKQPDEVRKRIGVALQEAALDMLMTGQELVELQAKLHGLRRGLIKHRAEELIERVGLKDAKDRRVATYSGGMRRRLDLAMALVNDPVVLFLDEPTTGLDPISRSSLWEEVRRLKRDGTTVFLTTQYLEEADELADRVGIINQGEIVAEGTPTELKNEVGVPHLQIAICAESSRTTAAEVLSKFGTMPETQPTDGRLSVGVSGGSEAIAPVVRALNESGIKIDSIDLKQPSLDDVFLAKTGTHLGEEE